MCTQKHGIDIYAGTDEAVKVTLGFHNKAEYFLKKWVIDCVSGWVSKWMSWFSKMDSSQRGQFVKMNINLMFIGPCFILIVE